jgi:hypothetical protein
MTAVIPVHTIYTTDPTHLTAFADGDNDSDGNDFLIWQRRLGAASASAATEAVPEPTSAFLLVLAGLASIGSRKCLAK